MKSFLDFLRWAIILAVWGLILVILFRNDTHWIWILAWAIGGLILVVNLVGFATLPLYAALGYKNAKDWKNKARFPNVYEDDDFVETGKETVLDTTPPSTSTSITTEDYLEQAIEFFISEDFQSAIASYTKIIELDSDFAGAYLNRGYAYFELEQYDKAIDDFTQCIVLKPDYGDAYYTRGYSYYRLEQYEEALKDYDKTLEIDPDHSLAIKIKKTLLKEHPELKP